MLSGETHGLRALLDKIVFSLIYPPIHIMIAMDTTTISINENRTSLFAITFTYILHYKLAHTRPHLQTLCFPNTLPPSYTVYQPLTMPTASPDHHFSTPPGEYCPAWCINCGRYGPVRDFLCQGCNNPRYHHGNYLSCSDPLPLLA